MYNQRAVTPESRQSVPPPGLTNANRNTRMPERELSTAGRLTHRAPHKMYYRPAVQEIVQVCTVRNRKTSVPRSAQGTPSPGSIIGESKRAYSTAVRGRRALHKTPPPSSAEGRLMCAQHSREADTPYSAQGASPPGRAKRAPVCAHSTGGSGDVVLSTSASQTGSARKAPVCT